MPKLSTLGKVNICRVRFDGEVVSVTYDPKVVTREWMRRLQGLDKSDEREFNELMCEVVKSWDVTDDEGNALPFTTDVLDALPTPFAAAVTSAVIEAVMALNPKAMKAASSAAG